MRTKIFLSLAVLKALSIKVAAFCPLSPILSKYSLQLNKEVSITATTALFSTPKQQPRRNLKKVSTAEYVVNQLCIMYSNVIYNSQMSSVERAKLRQTIFPGILQKSVQS